MNPNIQNALILSAKDKETNSCVVDLLQRLDITSEIIQNPKDIAVKVIDDKIDILILFLSETDFNVVKKIFKQIEKETVFILGIGPEINKELNGFDYYVSRKEITPESLTALLKGVLAVNHKIKLQAELSGMIIHDIRSPMQSILSYLELLESQVFGPMNEGQQKMLKNTIRLQDRILDMIEELGEVMRFENKSFRLEKSEFKIKELLQEVIKALWIQADKKNIKFSISLSDEKHSIYADYLALNRVFTNILTNAIRYSPESGTVRIECNCSQHADNKKVCQFKVTDSGPGINEEDMDLIFDKYYRVHRGKSAKGFGLGLYVARLFIEEHGGTIGVYNNREGGATFHFQLPLRK